MDQARKVAYFALRDVEENKAYSNFAVQNAINKWKPERAAFARELVYGTIRMQLYLDDLIGLFIKTPVHKLPVSDRILLRIGLYQLSSLDSIPDYAAVSETVELAKRYAKGRESFINGVLRRYLRERDTVAIPDQGEDEARYLSVKYSFAPWITRMWLDQFESFERVASLLNALNQRPFFYIRVNTLRIRPEDLKKSLEALGFTVTVDEDLPDLFSLEGENPLATDLYRDGFFSVQDKASRIAAESVGALPGDRVIDVCAAPGGKTMAIAESMKNQGEIIAADIHPHKIDLINKEAARLGVTNVTAKEWDSRIVCEKLENSADKVLVDAPCSGLGTARRKPEVKYKPFDEAMRTLPAFQLDILKTAAHYVKLGGALVYSTCTIAKRENQDVVDAFLKLNDEYQLVDMIQLMPMTGKTDGFFISKMERISPGVGG